MRRRQLLTASAIAVAGLAGCSGGSDSGNNGESGELAAPTNSVETFYDTLFTDNDIEGANELYHPESPAPELKASDFAEFGGIESISAGVVGTEVVSQEDGRARVHADISYNTPAGSATNEDWFVFREQDGEWLVSMWLPQSARADLSDEEIEETMQSA